MKTIHVKVNPARLNLPLATIWAGRLSSAILTVCGDVPDDIEALSVRIGRTPDPDTGAAREDFAATASRDESGAFRFYLSPFLFPDAAAGLSYCIIGTDESGNPRWLGTGALNVSECPADGDGTAPDIIPADTYIRNPVTGLYHLLTAVADEDGNITINLADEGVAR